MRFRVRQEGRQAVEGAGGPLQGGHDDAQRGTARVADRVRSCRRGGSTCGPRLARLDRGQGRYDAAPRGLPRPASRYRARQVRAARGVTSSAAWAGALFRARTDAATRASIGGVAALRCARSPVRSCSAGRGKSGARSTDRAEGHRGPATWSSGARRTAAALQASRSTASWGSTVPETVHLRREGPPDAGSPTGSGASSARPAVGPRDRLVAELLRHPSAEGDTAPRSERLIDREGASSVHARSPIGTARASQLSSGHVRSFQVGVDQAQEEGDRRQARRALHQAHARHPGRRA